MRIATQLDKQEVCLFYEVSGMPRTRNKRRSTAVPTTVAAGTSRGRGRARCRAPPSVVDVNAGGSGEVHEDPATIAAIPLEELLSAVGQ